METINFTSSIAAKISADEAIKRISNVPGWWGVTFSGSSEKQNDQFIINMGGDSFFNFTVAELIPGKRVVWLVTDCYMPWYSDKKEWANTKLVFDLTEKNGVTELNFALACDHGKATHDRIAKRDYREIVRCNPGANILSCFVLQPSQQDAFVVVMIGNAKLRY